MLYIIAGSEKQASRYAKEAGLQYKDWTYIYHFQQLCGIRHGSKYVKVGTWDKNPNINKIMLRLEMLKAEEL